ncbi:MAG: hypothetical protein ABI855_10860 [Bacteroidota bacterium]
MAKNKIEAPHVGEMLRKYVKEKRIFQSAWAREQQIKPKTVISYFKRSTMQTETLFTICQVLNYNFIRQVADRLPANMPPYAANPLEQENAALKKEIEMLKHEVEILNRVVGVKKEG